MVLLVIGTAAAFSWLMAFLKVPAALVAWMNTISDNPLIVLLLLNLLMLLLGTFMDMGPTIIITTPIFLPVVQAYGIDPVQFGVDHDPQLRHRARTRRRSARCSSSPAPSARSRYGNRCARSGRSMGRAWSCSRW